ncbi:MAG: hypothetical protein WBL21_00085 [Salinimicrobium sp.]
MSTLSNRSKYLTAFAFLAEVISGVSNELQNVFSQDGIRMTRHTVFVRKNATNAGSSWKVIDENTKKKDGVSSFGDQKLNKNQAVVFDKIALGFAEGDAEGQEGALDYSSTKAPAVLRNATLVITQGTREVLEIPVADMVKVTSPTKMEDYYHDLEGFNLLADDQEMDWKLVFPSGQVFAPSAAGKQNYIELRLQGYKTIKKA